MTSDDKFAAATHLYVLMRRKSGRVIDTVWMAQNVEYASEIIKLARAKADPEIAKLADRFEAVMFGQRSEAVSTSIESTADSAKSAGKYVRGLRC